MGSSETKIKSSFTSWLVWGMSGLSMWAVHQVWDHSRILAAVAVHQEAADKRQEAAESKAREMQTAINSRLAESEQRQERALADIKSDLREIRAVMERRQ